MSGRPSAFRFGADVGKPLADFFHFAHTLRLSVLFRLIYIIKNLYCLSPPSIYKRYVDLTDKRYFGMFIQLKTTMTKMPFGLTIHWSADGLDDFFFFERVHTKENLFLFVTTPATNIT